MTGGGQIEAEEEPDSFGGNAGPFRSTFRGEWNHVTHEDEDPFHFHAHVVDFVECFNVPGDPAFPPAAPANAMRFTGTGTLDGEDGCEYEVYVEDHGEPGRGEDVYSIDISCTSGATYSASDVLLRGNIQIHAVPPGHLPR